MKNVFKIFNIESKKEREISIGDIKYKIKYVKIMINVLLKKYLEIILVLF